MISDPAAVVGRARVARWLWPLAGVAAGALIWWQVVAVLRVDGDSMAPTFPSGSVVIVLRPGLDRWLGLRPEYRAGDLVVADVPGGLSLKRVAAVGPAVLSLEAGLLRVDGAVVPAPYADRAGIATLGPTVVAAGELYLLGDDRRPLASRDSRDFGPVDVGDVRGRVVAGFRAGG